MLVNVEAKDETPLFRIFIANWYFFENEKWNKTRFLKNLKVFEKKRQYMVGSLTGAVAS